MVNQCANIRTVTLSFGRLDVAESWEKADSPLVGAVPNQAKAFLPRIPLDSTSKQHPLKGFFALKVAALQAKPSAPVSGVEVKTKPVQHLQGMLHRKPIGAGRESNRGYMCGKLGRAEWAVADSD